MGLVVFIPLAGCIINLALAAFVLYCGRRETVNRLFFLLGSCIAVWNFGIFFLFIAPDKESAEFWDRFLWSGVVFIPVLLFHISLVLAQIKRPKWMPFVYIPIAALSASTASDFFLWDVRLMDTQVWYAEPGPGLYIATGPFTLMFVAVVILLKKRKSLPWKERSRLTPVIASHIMLAVFGTNDILPFFGIDKYPFTNKTVFPYGSFAAFLYGILVGYAVLHHQLLNVRVHISGFVAQAIRFLFLFLIGLLLLLVAYQVRPAEFTTFAFVSGLVVLMLSSIVASILFPRLLGGTGLEKWERRLLGDHFEYQDQMRTFIERMSWYQDTHTLLNDLHDLLVRTFRIGSFKIILRNPTQRTFELVRSHPEEPPRQVAELSFSSPVFQFFEWGKAEYLSLDASQLRRSSSALERQARAHLVHFGLDYCFPLAWQTEPFGLLLTGSKATGAPYTATDINLLVALVKNMSLIVNQIRMRDQILQTQELDLLGRMSRGMAHDLNNLLTPVWTLLQLASEGMTPQAFDDELLPVALRNIKTMRAYIKEALFFSENLRPDFQLGRLDMLVVQAAEMAKNSRKKSVDVVTRSPGEVLVEMDEVLIQRLIANVISNAIDASPPGSRIDVELMRLAKTESARDWLRVRITDQGEGISKENLNRVFTPYFTTKDRGDETRGFGLGLAICRKIVNLHAGNLSISSQLNRGTTVQVDLPSRQIKPTEPALAALQ